MYPTNPTSSRSGTCILHNYVRTNLRNKTILSCDCLSVHELTLQRYLCLSLGMKSRRPYRLVLYINDYTDGYVNGVRIVTFHIFFPYCSHGRKISIPIPTPQRLLWIFGLIWTFSHGPNSFPVAFVPRAMDENKSMQKVEISPKKCDWSEDRHMSQLKLE